MNNINIYIVISLNIPIMKSTHLLKDKIKSTKLSTIYYLIRLLKEFVEWIS